jgi:hypothetical protein
MIQGQYPAFLAFLATLVATNICKSPVELVMRGLENRRWATIREFESHPLRLSSSP